MDTVKLEKQIRIVPLLACIAILLARQTVEDPNSLTMVWVSCGLAMIAILAFAMRIYLEKKNGTYVARRYYVLWFILLFGAATFLYQLWSI